MRRLMAFITIFVLVLSHGSMGEAAPHFDDHASHAAMASSDLDAHHANPVQPDADRDMGHATHVHVAFDVARVDAIDAPAPAIARSRAKPQVSVALPSRGVAPLLEPPSA